MLLYLILVVLFVLLMLNYLVVIALSIGKAYRGLFQIGGHTPEDLLLVSLRVG